MSTDIEHTSAALRLELLEARYSEYRHQWNLEKDLVRKAKWAKILDEMQALIRRVKVQVNAR